MDNGDFLVLHVHKKKKRTYIRRKSSNFISLFLLPRFLIGILAHNAGKGKPVFMWNIPTTEELKEIPRLYETEDIPPNDKIIYLHFFVGACDWYIAEYNGDDTFYGYANLGDSDMAEWGYISFSELREMRINAEITDAETLEHKEIPSTVEIEVDCDRFWRTKKFGEIERIKKLSA